MHRQVVCEGRFEERESQRRSNDFSGVSTSIGEIAEQSD
jgi:hypothetical protein